MVYDKKYLSQGWYPVRLCTLITSLHHKFHRVWDKKHGLNFTKQDSLKLGHFTVNIRRRSLEKYLVTSLTGRHKQTRHMDGRGRQVYSPAESLID